MMMFVAMVIVAVISLTRCPCIDLPKENIQHNKCHTDNVKPEQSHGHTEPHVKSTKDCMNCWSPIKGRNEKFCHRKCYNVWRWTQKRYKQNHFIEIYKK